MQSNSIVMSKPFCGGQTILQVNTPPPHPPCPPQTGSFFVHEEYFIVTGVFRLTTGKFLQSCDTYFQELAKNIRVKNECFFENSTKRNCLKWSPNYNLIIIIIKTIYNHCS